MLAPAAAAVVAEMAETPAVPAKVAEVPPLAAANSFGSSDQLTVRRYLDSTVVPVLRGAMRELCIKRWVCAATQLNAANAHCCDHHMAWSRVSKRWVR